jgi:hypothetical protein
MRRIDTNSIDIQRTVVVRSKLFVFCPLPCVDHCVFLRPIFVRWGACLMVNYVFKVVYVLL